MTDMSSASQEFELTPEELEEYARLEAEREAWRLDDKSLMYHVERGMQGLNRGMGNGLNRINHFLYGTHRGTYYLIGADSGVGKTTLTDFMYVYSLYMSCKASGIPLYIDYYSFEISVPMKKAKWAALLYYLKYKENIPPQYIIGRIDGMTLTDVQFQRILSVSREIEEIFGSIHFIEDSVTPGQFWEREKERAAALGSIKTKDKVIVGYTPKDPKAMVITVVDHIALGEPGKGQSTKTMIDTYSLHAVKGRNRFGNSYAIIQQFNTEMQGAARERKSAMAYMPTRMDFGDSRYTYRDADVVFGLTQPSRFQLNEFGVYKRLESWGEYFLILSLMKNRYGSSNRNIPLFMNPIAGIPEELPDSQNWTEILEDAFIDAASELDKICHLYFPEQNPQQRA